MSAEPLPPRIHRAWFMTLAECIDAVSSSRRPAQRVVAEVLRRHRKMGSRDRRSVRELVYRWMRARVRLEHDWPSGDAHAYAIRTLVEDCGYAWDALPLDHHRIERALSDRCPPPAENAPLIARVAYASSLPERLVAALCDVVGSDSLMQAASALGQPAPTTLRCNTERADRAQVLSALQDRGVDARPGSFSPLAILIRGRWNARRDPLYENGDVEIQDEGSQLLALVCGAAVGDSVLDYCAGAGGKTLALAAAVGPTGRVAAHDIGDRMAPIRERAARAGVASRLSVHPREGASLSDDQRFDLVLVDAPCTGSGTLRRAPDRAWHIDDAEVARCTAAQRAILDEAARYVRAGGRLVYATCSFLRAENEDIAEAFSEGTDTFTPEPVDPLLAAAGVDWPRARYLRTFPHEHDTDAFFAAVWRRSG